MNFVQANYQRARHVMTRAIWQTEVLNDRSPRGWACAVLRVVSMTWTGITENKLTSRAAALSYSSMLGFAPLVALAVLFSGVVLGRQDSDFALKHLNRAMEFIAPQLRQLRVQAPPEGPNSTEPSTTVSPPAAGAASEPLAVNPELLGWLNTFIQSSQSKTIGIMGALVLILIVIQLFSSIENAFNDIWGVRRGRNWVLRIVFYWAAVTLGAVLTFASLTLLSASALIGTMENLPLGTEMRRFFEFAAPLISLGVLAGLLTLFYKFIPNTSVAWKPAFAGGIVAVSLLYLNNFLAFLYLKRVVFNQSLYGSVALPWILIFGMFIFWLFLLVGGQITYAVQNANYRTSNMVWHDLNHASREGITLLIFTLICRRFRECLKPFGPPELSEQTKIPTQIINASLTRLMQLGLVSRLPPDDDKTGLDHRFQPARPLDRVTLAEFKDLFEGFGDGPSRAVLDALDPVVRQFHHRLHRATAEALGTETLDSVIARLSGELPVARTETIGTIRTT